MRRLLLAALVAVSPAHSFPLVAKGDNASVTLHDTPCMYASVLRFINEPHRNRFRKAEVEIQGQRYFACWIDLGSHYGVIDEDGDQFGAPASAFKEGGV